ncbi:MAG TPA: SLC13 family permease [Devosia sp.]
MTTAQVLSFAVIAVLMAAFIWGRFRYDIVAAAGLLVAVLVGIVPPEAAFSGFANDIVIIVGSALIVSAAVSRSGIMEIALQRYAPNVSSPRVQLLILVAVVAALSAFVKNIGALAIMIPIAFQMARRSNVSPSMFLMPMSFAALLGGLMTQIGTSPNIIVSQLRRDLTGTSFQMFDFTPVGLALSLAGIVFLALFYWLLPARSREGLAVSEAMAIRNYTTEATVEADAAVIGKTVAELQKMAGGRAMVTSIISAHGRKRKPLPDAVLRLGDRLILEGEPEALDAMVEQGDLTMGDREHDRRAEIAAIEAIIGPNSDLIGSTASEFALFERTGINLLAVARRERRFSERLSQIRFEAGDIVLLQGNRDQIGEQLRALDCLPLVERNLKLGAVRNRLLPVGILAAAMVITAFGLLPVAVAFFAAAVIMIATRTLPLRDIYGQLDGPILLMLACLIPVSDSLRTTGATDLIAMFLSDISTGLPPFAALTLIMLAAMAVTPFLNNAATVLVMAPIAATFAGDLGLRPEAFLMAVAIGAGCDFLTPIGHQCNTLVMGPGGYRFGDYWRLGLPLSILVVLIAVPLLLVVWPVA